MHGVHAQARCHTAPAAGSFGLDENVPLRPLGPQQCLLVTDGDVMQVQGDLWLDGLYLRMRNTVRFPTPQLLLVRGPPGGADNGSAAGRPAGAGGGNGGGGGGGMLWMSFCTVQGEQWSGSGGITGLQTFGNVHAQGVPRRLRLPVKLHIQCMPCCSQARCGGGGACSVRLLLAAVAAVATPPPWLAHASCICALPARVLVTFTGTQRVGPTPCDITWQGGSACV